MKLKLIDLINVQRSDLRYTLIRMQQGTDYSSLPESLSILIDPINEMINKYDVKIENFGMKHNGGKWDLGIDDPKWMLVTQEGLMSRYLQWNLWGIPRNIPIIHSNIPLHQGLDLIRKSCKNPDGSLIGTVTPSGKIEFSLSDCEIIAAGAVNRRSWTL